MNRSASPEMPGRMTTVVLFGAVVALGVGLALGGASVNAPQPSNITPMAHLRFFTDSETGCIYFRASVHGGDVVTPRYDADGRVMGCGKK